MTIEKEQRAELPAVSVNVYWTSVIPLGNVLPGSWDLTTVGVEPELSVAVGSIHTTVLEVVPKAMV